MATVRKRILIVLSCAVVFLLGICAFTACGASDYTVTFLVQNDEGIWAQYGEPVTSDGENVSLPATNPSKTDYVFRCWYKDEAFSSEFDGSGVKTDMSVYARFVPVEIKISLNGGTEESVELRNLQNVEADYIEAAATNALTFDGWYTDSGYTVKYSAGMDATTLYARYMAQIIYDNGYEQLYTEKVQINAPVTQPGAETIVKSYMDTEDISYVNADNAPFDFAKGVSGNTTITVWWKTPYLKYEQAANGDWICRGFDAVVDENGKKIDYNYASNGVSNTVPVVSFLSDVTYNGQKIKVVGVRYQGSGTPTWTGPRKMIFGEGIEYIAGFSDSYSETYMVEEIGLPSTLKLIDGAFCGMPYLKSVTIPDGVETIIDSFWRHNYTSSNFEYIEQRTGYNFEIAIPDSVTTLSQVPTNFTFSENSRFYNDEENRIYMTDEQNRKVLIADYNIVDGKLVVEEGVQGIQVGAFVFMPKLTYLTLPSTWSFVNYNPDVSKYAYYMLSSETSSRNLYNPQYANDPQGHMNSEAYSITNLIDLLTTAAINRTAWPESVSDYAVVGCTTSSTAIALRNTFASYAANEKFAAKVVLVGKVPAGEDCLVKIGTINTMVPTELGSYTLTLKSGETLTRERLLAAAGLISDTVAVSEISQFGDAYDFSATVNTNLYLDVYYGLENVLGFTYSGDAELTVTGFDVTTAHLLNDKTYLIDIPDEIDGKKVAAIADGAFKNNQAISMVYISGNVKSIGAEAFRGCSNLTYVEFKDGGVQKIGTSAFRETGFTTIALPLTDLLEVGPYAFKSEKLQYFTRYTGEESRAMYTASETDGKISVPFEGLTEGMFFLIGGSSLKPVSLVKYVKTTPTTDPANETLAVNMYDVDLVAIAGAGSTNGTFTLGYSTRVASKDNCRDAAVRFNVKEGSVYYLTNVKTIYFGIVSGVEKNAFTDITDISRAIKCFNYTRTKSEVSYTDHWVTLEQVTSVDSTIFAEGWWCGYSSDSDEYKNGILALMTAAQYYAWSFEN